MPRIINTRNVVPPRMIYQTKGRGVNGNRLSMLSIHPQEDKMEMETSRMDDDEKKQMSEIVNKLSKIKIINPKNTAKAKKEIKNKYITI